MAVYRQLAVVGAPDTVRAELARRAGAVGADEVMLTTNVFDPAAWLRSFELVAEAAGPGRILRSVPTVGRVLVPRSLSSSIRRAGRRGAVLCVGLGTWAGCSVAVDADAGTCPVGMAHVEGACVDRWEAHLEGQSPYDVPADGVARTAPGVVPQGYISGDVAAAACAAAGKRLCTSAEWLRACQGPEGAVFPYGDDYDASACNEGRSTHPVVELFGDSADWSLRQMNDPRLNQLPDAVDATGANPACVSAEGVFDLHGNLHEWVADPEGTFRGGFYVDAEINGAGCLYRTTAHGRAYHDYSTGFRCCADAR